MLTQAKEWHSFMTLTIFPWKFTNKVLQCLERRFYNYKRANLLKWRKDIIPKIVYTGVTTRPTTRHWKSKNITGFPVYKRWFACRIHSESVYEASACWGVLPNSQGKTCSGQISAPFRNRNTPVLAGDVAHPFPVLCGQRHSALFLRGLRILAKACSA